MPGQWYLCPVVLAGSPPTSRNIVVGTPTNMTYRQWSSLNSTIYPTTQKNLTITNDHNHQQNASVLNASNREKSKPTSTTDPVVKLATSTGYITDGEQPSENTCFSVTALGTEMDVC